MDLYCHIHLKKFAPNEIEKKIPKEEQHEIFIPTAEMELNPSTQIPDFDENSEKLRTRKEVGKRGKDIIDVMRMIRTKMNPVSDNR